MLPGPGPPLVSPAAPQAGHRPAVAHMRRRPPLCPPDRVHLGEALADRAEPARQPARERPCHNPRPPPAAIHPNRRAAASTYGQLWRTIDRPSWAVHGVGVRRQSPRTTSAALLPRFAKCARLNSTQHHSAHLSGTINNRSARRIKTIPVLHQMKPALVAARCVLNPHLRLDRARSTRKLAPRHGLRETPTRETAGGKTKAVTK